MNKHLYTAIRLYAVCYLLSVYLISGMLYSQSHDTLRNYWGEYKRREAGQAIALASVGAAIWPLAVPLTYCLTGFAEHGVWE